MHDSLPVFLQHCLNFDRCRLAPFLCLILKSYLILNRTIGRHGPEGILPRLECDIPMQARSREILALPAFHAQAFPVKEKLDLRTVGIHKDFFLFAFRTPAYRPAMTVYMHHRPVCPV